MSVTDKPLAIIGAGPGFEPPDLPGVLVTSLSAETAVRNGFDVLLLETPHSRREAVELMRLAEEAEARVGFPRWLRRTLEGAGKHAMVSIVADARCGMDDLIDLAVWLSGSHGVQRVEAQVASETVAVALRGHGGQLMSIHTSTLLEEVRVSAEGGPDGALLASVPWQPDRGLAHEIERFASGDGGFVLIEDSIDLVAVLERVHKRVR